MKTELVKSKTELITQSKINEYLDAFGFANQLQKNEKKQFIEIACAFQLNPFKREIYCIPYNTKQGRKLSIITGYEVYLKRAERSGKLAGWKVWTEGEGNNLKACIEIRRKDWEQPLYHEVYFSEYAQKTYDKYNKTYVLNSMWKSKPMTMLKKVVIAQGFRLAFPDELGGMPYTTDELPDEMTQTQKTASKVIDITTEEPEQKPAPKPKKTTNFKFLKAMQELKKQNEEVYYSVLSDAGFKHANEITDRQQQLMVYKTIKADIETIAASTEPEEASAEPEPAKNEVSDEEVAKRLQEVFGGEVEK